MEYVSKLQIGLALLYVEAEFIAGCLGDACSLVTQEYQIVGTRGYYTNIYSEMFAVIMLQ